jgi:acetyltransferase-like isoleucine patch superfamily enzyme
MINLSDVKSLMHAFPGSYLNGNLEFIPVRKGGLWFSIYDCSTSFDLKAKVLEYLSRCYKTEPYSTKRNNDIYVAKMLEGINTYLGTNFSLDDMETIYTYLGNGCNHERTIRFLSSGMNMEFFDQFLIKKLPVKEREEKAKKVYDKLKKDVNSCHDPDERRAVVADHIRRLKLLEADDANQKYELTEETKFLGGFTLHRIRALRDISDNVKCGDLGGFVESQENLSTSGDAWVYHEACVFEDGYVGGDAAASGRARVSGKAAVIGNACIGQSASITENAVLMDEATLCGKADLAGNAVCMDTAMIHGNCLVAENARISGNALIDDFSRISGNTVVVDHSFITKGAEYPAKEPLAEQGEEREVE